MGEKNGYNDPNLEQHMVSVTYIGNFLSLKICMPNKEYYGFQRAAVRAEVFLMRKLTLCQPKYILWKN